MKWRGIGIEVDEYELLPSLSLYRNQAILLALETLDAIELRHALQRTIQPIVPSVIRTMQQRGLAALLGDNRSCMMATDVIEAAQRAIVPTNHDNRFASDNRRHKLAGFFNLVDATNQLPCLAEDGLGCQISNSGVNVPWRRNRRCFRQGGTVVVTGQNLLDC